MEKFALFLLLQIICCLSTYGINHWVLKSDGRIMQRIDSPFYMREPKNLVAFLNQIKYNDMVEKSYLELLRQREEIIQHLQFSVQFGEDLMEQAECALDYYNFQKSMSYVRVTPAYLQRLRLPSDNIFDLNASDTTPNCAEYMKLPNGPCCYDHLESFNFVNLQQLTIEPEDSMNIVESAGRSAYDFIRRISVAGLKKYPMSWKYYTYSSFYWRMVGQAQKAIECARLSLLLAPREFRDIPLLSLGIIVFHAGHLADADVLLTAAVDHAPHISENHAALASTLALTNELNRSLYHFDEAERLDPSLLPHTEPLRNFIACLENLTKKTEKMYSYVKYMENEVNDFKKLKQEIAQNNELMLQHQVPLAVRVLNDGEFNEDLVKRGQYCSKRNIRNDGDPVLFCDFYSEMQMRLESKEVDVDGLERDLKMTSETVLGQVAVQLNRKINLEDIVQKALPSS